MLQKHVFRHELKLTRNPLLPFVITFVVLLFIINIIEVEKFSLLPQNLTYLRKYNRYLVNLPGCRIPNFNAFETNILEFIDTPKNITCTNDTYKGTLFHVANNHVHFDTSALQDYNTTIEQVMCCYRSLTRGHVHSAHSDLIVSKSETCEPLHLTHPNKINHEFIQVQCTSENVTFYTDFFNFVPKQSRKTPELNVLIVGIDAVSRLNLHRQLPRTVAYLQSIGAVEMLGYNKVGDNTFPNLIPVLTGLYEDELKVACLNNTYTSHFDACPFVWKRFKSRGYHTAFIEDAVEMGLFNYQRNGFKRKPVDFDYRIFDYAASKTIGHTNHLNANLCFGARLRYKVFLDYVKTFVRNVDGFFAFAWSVSLSHDYLNYPKLSDGDYLEFFANDFTRIAERTVLIFMSDHGIRWGGIRQTIQGKYEERLPFLFVRLPKWFEAKYPRAVSNLVSNVNRLTTPFDLHETLMDLTDLELTEESSSSRGVSLFVPVQANRTCESAGIPEHFCTCQKVTTMEPSSERSKRLAEYLVDYINRQLIGYGDCATLRLKKVVSVTQNEHLGHLTSDEEKTTTAVFTVVFETLPGLALFEGALRETNEEFVVPNGTISRLNLYGSQSQCVGDFHLKLFCYCR